MDHIQIGLRVRALRRRKGWRQQDLADAVGLSQSTISLIERGHLGTLALRSIARVFAALDASIVLEVRWRAGVLDRLVDEDPARLSGGLVSLLTELGWQVRTEVTYAQYAERGSIDVLAFHPPTGSLLVIEVKTDLPSAEAALRKLDEKLRLAPAIARERFGWDCSNRLARDRAGRHEHTAPAHRAPPGAVRRRRAGRRPDDALMARAAVRRRRRTPLHLSQQWWWRYPSRRRSRAGATRVEKGRQRQGWHSIECARRFRSRTAVIVT